MKKPAPIKKLKAKLNKLKATVHKHSTRKEVVVADTSSPIASQLALVDYRVKELTKKIDEINEVTIATYHKAIPPVGWFASIALSVAVNYFISPTIIETAKEYQLSAWASGYLIDLNEWTANASLNYGVRSVGGETTFASPLKGKLVVTSHFNPSRVHPKTGKVTPHRGTDYRCNIGDPVYAMRSGVVEFAQYKGNAGNMVIIGHSNGQKSVYMHLDKIVSGLKKVSTGQRIGDCGATGRVTGKHLHVAIYDKNSKALNPVHHIAISTPSDMWVYFKDTVAQSESRGSGGYRADNGIYKGRYQMGRAALKDAGYGSVQWDFFLKNPELQDKAYKKWQAKNLVGGRYGIGGVRGFITNSTPAYKVAGFLHAAQFGAKNALKWYVKGVEFKDGNGVRISTYAKRGEDAFISKYGRFASGMPLLKGIED